MRNLVVTGIMKTIFNYGLTSIPMLNIKGAAIGTLLAFTIGSALNLYYLQRMTEMHYEFGRMLKLILITIAMGVSVKLSYSYLVASGLVSNLSTLAAITIGIAIYGGLLFLFKEFDMDMVRKIIK
jgi:stage V sporulation protein B